MWYHMIHTYTSYAKERIWCCRPCSICTSQRNVCTGRHGDFQQISDAIARSQSLIGLSESWWLKLPIKCGLFYRWSIKFSWIFSNFSRFFPGCKNAPARDYSCYSFRESSRAPGSESPARIQNGHELPRTEQNFQKWPIPTGTFQANPMSATASDAHRFTTFSRACAQRPSKSAVVSRDDGNSCRQIRAISMYADICMYNCIFIVYLQFYMYNIYIYIRTVICITPYIGSDSLTLIFNKLLIKSPWQGMRVETLQPCHSPLSFSVHSV